MRDRWTAGLHGESSLYGRTIRNVLTAEQQARFEAVRRDAQQKLHQAGIQEVLRMIESRLSLTDAQRSKLNDLLTTKTEMILVEGTLKGDEPGFFRSLGRIPEDDWKPVFTEAEWPRVKQLIELRQPRPVRAGAVVIGRGGP